MTQRIDRDSNGHGRFGQRAVPHVVAPEPRWLTLGLAALVGTLAGTMLFATRAEGETDERRRPSR